MLLLAMLCRLYRSDLSILVIKDEKYNLVNLLKVESKCIIFCHSIETVYDVTGHLQSKGFIVFPYTGGQDMTNEVRMANQANFKNSSSGVLVATKAQAFGVNYSNISKVIIYELPDSMEVLYQMIGRASREGKSGAPVIFHNRRIIS